MADLLHDITVSVKFDLTDSPAFWADIAAKAAEFDQLNIGEPQASYSQAQALTVVFHYDGLETIQAIAERHRINAGWSVESTWETLGEIGAMIPATKEA